MKNKKRQPFGSAHGKSFAALERISRKSPTRIAACGYRCQGRFWIAVAVAQAKEQFATATQEDDLFFMKRRPAEAGCDGGLVEFALDHVLRATVIETEDLVIKVESIHDEAQAAGHSDAAL